MSLGQAATLQLPHFLRMIADQVEADLATGRAFEPTNRSRG
jgi:hypothetical protein